MAAMQALQVLKQQWLRLLGRATAAGAAPVLRVSGDPPSPNRASSMHLWWSLPYGELITSVSATLEILEPPALDRLYFWALQAAFVKPDGGGAHLGIQHNRRHPLSTAVNFGGYAPRSVGGLLQGIESPLPSTPSDENTRDYEWVPNRMYRLLIERVPGDAPEGFHAWRGSIEDLHTGRFSVVRVLFSRGKFLRGPVVWTESFARCEHPSVAVRWTDLEAVGERRGAMSIESCQVNYQAYDAGGCDNTNQTVDGGGWVQRTNTERTVPTGAMLAI
jgi:hypothetical protein